MNPFKILNIDVNVSKKEIIQAVAIAMRTRKYSSKEIAIAQKELLNPITYESHRLINSIDNFSKNFEKEIQIPKIPKKQKIKYLSVFDEAL